MKACSFQRKFFAADKIWSAVAKNIWRETGGFTDHADTALGSGTVPVPENKSPESGWDAGAADML
jgi:hypothetical protein